MWTPSFLNVLDIDSLMLTFSFNILDMNCSDVDI